jgi:hypothetical protein
VRKLRITVASGVLMACAESVAAQTPAAPNPARSFGPDACGPADPAYIHSANVTGGIPLFLQRSEAGKAFQLVRESSRNNVSTIFWGTGSLAGTTESIEIPVDAVTQRVTFTFSTDTKGATFILKQPSGGAIAESTASTELTELNCGRIVTISTPEAGTWRAEVSGSGKYWLQAQAQGDIHIIKAEFVKLGGRPGHEGFFRIAGQPLAGKLATLQVSLSAKETKTANFQLVDERGTRIRELKLRPLGSDREFMEFSGEVNLPSAGFRIAVTGRDSHDRTYQRFYPGLFHEESVEVTAGMDWDELAAGETKQAAFTVRNIGEARKFKVTVSDAHHFVSGVEPAELSLAAGESGEFLVRLQVPASANPGTGDDLVAVVVSTAGSSTTNSCVVHLSVHRKIEQSVN